MQEEHGASAGPFGPSGREKTWYRPLRTMEELLDDLLADLAPAPVRVDPELGPDTPLT